MHEINGLQFWNHRIKDECMRSMASNSGTTESTPGAARTSPPPKKFYKD